MSWRRVPESWRATSPDVVVIDLREVSFMDSTGLKVAPPRQSTRLGGRVVAEAHPWPRFGTQGSWS